MTLRGPAGSWEVVGLFNFDGAPAKRSVRFDRLGLDPASEHAAWEFWEERLLGIGKDGIEVEVPPEACRILSIRRIEGRPQLLGTDLHLLGGFHELKALSWDPEKSLLSGAWRRAPGITGKAFFLVPGLVTLAAYVKIGIDHAPHYGQPYVPTFLQQPTQAGVRP